MGLAECGGRPLEYGMCVSIDPFRSTLCRFLCHRNPYHRWRVARYFHLRRGNNTDRYRICSRDRVVRSIRFSARSWQAASRWSRDEGIHATNAGRRIVGDNFGTDFRTALQAIIAAGGDTDTNGAVAGALMGARMGYAALPETWVTGLLNKELLEERIEHIIRHSNMANI